MDDVRLFGGRTASAAADDSLALAAYPRRAAGAAAGLPPAGREVAARQQYVLSHPGRYACRRRARHGASDRAGDGRGEDAVYSRTQRARRPGFHRDAAQAVVGQEPQRGHYTHSAQARRIRGARRSGDPRRTLLTAARARLLAVRNLCRTLPPRYRGARGGLQPFREVSLSRRRPARFTGRRTKHRHVLLFPSSENRRDLEEDARNASGAGVGRGRQRLPSAAVRYAELRRILDAILCRYRTEVSHQGHRQVRDRRRPQLHSVLRGRYPCGRYAGRQPAAVG